MLRGLCCLIGVYAAGAVVLVCGLGVVAPPAAHAGISVGGAINPIPTSTILHTGDIIDVTVRLSNTSFTTDPDPFEYIPATLLSGTMAAFLACDDSFCATELPGTLEFVPTGANGCVSNLPNVVSCAQDGANSNQVNVVIGGAGVPLPERCSPPTMSCVDPTFVDVATIRLKAVTPAPGTGTFALVGFTDLIQDQIIASFGISTATGGAQGSTAFLYPGDPIGDPCTGDTDCQSGFCVDGVCCSTACRGPAQACNRPDSIGHCTTDHTAPVASAFGEGLLVVGLLLTGLWTMRGVVRRGS